MTFEQRQNAQLERIVRWGRGLVALVLLGLVVALGRVVQLKVRPEAALRPYLDPPTATHREIGRRGDIIDNRGRVLATSVVGYRLFVDPKMVDDLDALARELAPRLGANPQEIVQHVAERLKANPASRYIVLDRVLEDWQVDAVRQGNLKGVGIEPMLLRHYPHGEVGASVVGFVNIDHLGAGGAELTLESPLKPHDGKLTYQRDARGRVLWIDDENYVGKSDGRDMRLSIDLVVQEFVEEALDKAARDFNARGARCVVMDVATGDLVAIADVIRDRKGFREVIPDDDRDKHPSWGRQRCVTDPYEPGSTFKPFVWAAAVDQGKARPSEIIPLPAGPYTTSHGRVIRDVHYTGPVSWEEVLVRSLNGGMAYVGERFSAKELRDVVRSFGFGDRTGCGLPSETAGLVTPLKQWRHTSQTSVPMGQEVGVTCVQMARAFSAFCRDGTMVEPRIAVPDEPSATGSNKVVVVPRRAISEAAALKTREVMRGVMTMGTGRKAQSELYEIFGKTGTPQLAVPRDRWREFGKKGYFDDRYISNFVAGAPFEHPRIVVVVTIDDPDKRKAHFGGLTAAPVARDIIDFTLSYLGVEPDIAADDDTDRPTPKETPGRTIARR
ncbi:MAG: penicillin-binding protein 2 [Phycisphaerales bacterium]